MCPRKCDFKLMLIFLTIPNLTVSGSVLSQDISTKLSNPSTNNDNLSQQQPKLSNIQNTHLNSLKVYAANYDAISNKENKKDNFKASYKLPEMETNFTPIHNSVASSSLASHAPVLMQYLPQTIKENGVQYLQLIPTSPLMVPIGSYLPNNDIAHSLAYHQHLVPSNSIEYAARPLLSTLPVNVPPPAASSLIDVPTLPLPSYSIQSHADSITPYKQTHRINRETKDKQLLGPLSLNLDEYIPSNHNQQHNTFNIYKRP